MPNQNNYGYILPYLAHFVLKNRSNILYINAHYHPFGMVMPGRHANEAQYRYGAANGQEKVDEISGSGNHYTAPYWEYDPRLARRWNQDPVFKEHESPYATFANNPIWFSDPDGADTLILHRSSPLQQFANDKSNVYLVTFSIVRDGVEQKLEETMYMIDRKEAGSRDDNSLNKPEYKLKWDYMSWTRGSGTLGDGWDDQIRVTEDGVFVHPGNSYSNFDGCYGVTESEPEIQDAGNGETLAFISNTGVAQEKIRTIYNQVDQAGKLTGDKFLLKTNSQAVEKPVETSSMEIDRLPFRPLEPIDSGNEN
jgi:RHS repeat-associated protein